MIKSTVIPALTRSFSESSDGDCKPVKMTSLLPDAKSEGAPQLTKARSFHALYSLKLNRGAGSKENSPRPSVLQLLDREGTLNKDFSLTLITNSLDARNESYLRESLAKKIEKGTLYASTNSGNISAFNLGFDRSGQRPLLGESEAENGSSSQIESICYYFLYRPQSATGSEFLVCFVLDDSEFNLDLFRNELDYYIENCVLGYLTDDLKHLSELEVALRNWYLYSVNYLVRTCSLLGEHLGVFIDQILSNGGVSYANFSKLLETHAPGETGVEEFCQLDLELFYTSLFCTYLMQSAAASSSPGQKPKADLNNSSLNASVNASMNRGSDGENDVLTIELNRENQTVSLSKTECSAFSRECAKSLLAELASSAVGNPFQLKQIIETYKLRLIQELNMLNRILRKAENHYYDLYKVYLYLKQSQMADVLVKMYKSCQSSSNDPASGLMLTFNVVIDFYKQRART